MSARRYFHGFNTSLMGNYSESEENLWRAVALLQAVRGAEDLDAARVGVSLAITLWIEKQYQTALAMQR